MSLQNRARQSVFPVRSHVERLTERYTVDGIFEVELVSGLLVTRVDEFVELEAGFTGHVGGVPTAELVTMTFLDFSNQRQLPDIRTEWQKGKTGQYRIGILGPVLNWGAEGKQAVKLKRFPQYSGQFLDLLNLGYELESSQIRELPRGG